MMRLIVTSSTYRQSSRETREMVERDPENRLLARGPRFRLPAEMVRDNALDIAGLLDTRIGGPSVYPYQPKGLWEEMAFGGGFSGQTYTQSTGEDLYRRSMYTVWKRTVPPPSADNVRRARPREVYGAAHHYQYAAAGAGAAQRSHLRRGQPRAGGEDAFPGGARSGEAG